MTRLKSALAAVQRRFGKTDTTICIPAYQAEAFIDRTLRCAQGQTYARIRILIAIDDSRDQTVEICNAFARDDRRIELIEHRERLGWCRNVNSLLDRVDTPYFFFYFHDDLILPQYCELMRDALIREGDAASANCDVLDFGEVDRLHRGRDYKGSVAKRILMLWTVPERGAPLRSMMRRDRVGADFRAPDEADNFIPGQTLLLRMMAAGNAVRVPATLYLRWQRKGGLTGGWRDKPIGTYIASWSRDLARVFALIDDKVAEPQHRAILKFAQTEFVLQSLAKLCQAANRPLPHPYELHPEASAFGVPAEIDQFGDEIAQAMRKLDANLTAVRANLAAC
jgi:glycosyltransferase involved in cell wall biosynthesis